MCKDKVCRVGGSAYNRFCNGPVGFIAVRLLDSSLEKKIQISGNLRRLSKLIVHNLNYSLPKPVLSIVISAKSTTLCQPISSNSK